ncbi:MAG TPA: uracil-DNA glycosylase family protein, partial [Solirubrobacteraceae bacterium]
GRCHGVVQTYSGAHRALGVLRRDFYAPRKVVPPWLEERLNARMVAFWFMDDGYMRVRPGRQPLAEIATDGFSDTDRQVLLRGLMRLGLPAKASRGRLYFDVPTSRRLSELIAPFVPEAMRHKLHPEVEAAVPLDPDRLRPGAPTVMFDEVEAEDVTHRPRPDRMFFCLDVEENHNFVTAGGVVHNCRPPGNRDPLPVEIENCSDYLRAQVRLIEPRVVCTLGNFSTKLLRDDTTGITRLHGQPEVRRIFGGRAVRLYPLYHPAAALYTPSMLDVLRADFARLPELLAHPAPEQPPLEDEPADEPPGPEAAAEAELEAEAAAGAEAVATGEEAAAEEEQAPPFAPPARTQLGLF